MLVLADGRTMLLNDSVGWGREADLQQVRLDEQGITYQQSDSLEKEEVFNTLIIPKGGEFQIHAGDVLTALAKEYVEKFGIRIVEE